MPVAVEAETLPSLDLRRFDGQASERSRFLEDLRTAARNVGFFYLVGHGIKDGLIQDVLKVSGASSHSPRRTSSPSKW